MNYSFVYNANQENDPKEFILPAGTWLFRIWGAQGGYVNNTNGGRGAYSEGIFITNQSVTIYTYVGAHGICKNENMTIKSKFGGGMNLIGEQHFPSCTGGDATFISRDIAAHKILLISGAGGGSGVYKEDEFLGGYGGPFSGDADGTALFMDAKNAKKVRGKGATYSHPGEGGQYLGDTKNHSIVFGKPGEYLIGGDSNSSAGGSSGGGGSGFYGGGGGADLAGGGGGSSFASYEMFNVVLLNGNKAFSSPTGELEIGHFGHGYIKIEPADPYTLEKLSLKCNYSPNCLIYVGLIHTFLMLSLELFLGLL